MRRLLFLLGVLAAQGDAQVEDSPAIPNDAPPVMDPMAPPTQGSAAPQAGPRRTIMLENEVHYAQEELHNALMRASMVGHLSHEQSAALESAALAGDKLVKIALHAARRRRRPHRPEL